MHLDAVRIYSGGGGVRKFAYKFTFKQFKNIFREPAWAMGISRIED
jgi:hypothetical protein